MRILQAIVFAAIIMVGALVGGAIGQSRAQSGVFTLAPSNTGSIRINGSTGQILDPDAAHFCGRHCNCGDGRPQEIEIDGGKKVKGVVPPDGSLCRCTEVYRCHLQIERAPANPAWCPAPNPWGVGIVPTGGAQ